jgi:uncharacterized membrane protein
VLCAALTIATIRQFAIIAATASALFTYPAMTFALAFVFVRATGIPLTHDIFVQRDDCGHYAPKFNGYCAHCCSVQPRNSYPHTWAKTRFPFRKNSEKLMAGSRHLVPDAVKGSTVTSALFERPASFLARPGGALRYISIVAWCAIILGAVFRLVQLPTRMFFDDEGITQMRVAGHTADEMWRTIYDGRQRTALALRQYTTVDASSTPARLIASLMSEDAQHAPLFYIAELGAVRAFGNALVVWRLLPALFGILGIAAAFALARALFTNAQTGLIAAALFAVSPIERIYSEQAREYSLFTLLVLVATLALVWATRAKTVRGWLLYALLAALGLYVSPLMGLAVAAHAAFVIGVSRADGRRETLLAFAAAVAAAIVAYAPWIYQLAAHRADIAATNAWSAQTWPFARLAAKWIFNIGSTFFDLEYIDLRWSVLFIIALIAAAIALERGFRTADREARWLLTSLILVPAITLALSDLLLGEHRSAVARYALPVFAGLTILAAHGLAHRPVFATLVIATGFISCAIGTLHPSWWDNDKNTDDVRIAQIISRAPHAQIVSGVAPQTLITFVRVLDDPVRISLRPNLSGVRFERADPVFVLDPDAQELAALRRQSGLRLIPVDYPRTLTAHDLGSKIGDAGTGGAAPETRLYVAHSGNVHALEHPSVNPERIIVSRRSGHGQFRKRQSRARGYSGVTATARDVDSVRLGASAMMISACIDRPDTRC